jgi:hypothetical protein
MGRAVEKHARNRPMFRDPSPLILLLALLFGFGQLHFPAGFGFGQGWETVAIARELVRTGAYANPFAAGASGATAVIAPLFPLYLAALMKLLGDTDAFAIAASVGVALAQALHAMLLPRVSMLFFGDVRPGIFAGVLSVFALRPMPQWDAMFTACGLLLFLLNARPATWRSSAISGAIAGLLLMTNPASILITGPWMVYWCERQKTPVFRVAGFAAIAFLVALPWMARNEWKLGTFSLKDNFGMTVYASNNDCAQSSIAATRAKGCYDAMHPNSSASELRLLNQMGEAAYDGIRGADAIRWVRAHHDAFLRLSALRVLDFWFPPAAMLRYSSFTIWLATALSFPGLFLMLRRRVPVFWFLLVVAAVYPPLYYVVVSDVRYRYPLLWVSLLSAGYLLSSLGDWLQTHRLKGRRQLKRTLDAGD